MATITTEQYLALSQFAYNNFNASDVGEPHATISWLIDNYPVEHKGDPQFAYIFSLLDEIGDWKLIGFQPNTSNGFAAMAFQAPDPKDENGNPILDVEGMPVRGDQVFALRGTEPKWNTMLADGFTDLGVALGNFVPQFNDAVEFFNEVREDYPSASYSFTGLLWAAVLRSI